MRKKGGLSGNDSGKRISMRRDWIPFSLRSLTAKEVSFSRIFVARDAHVLGDGEVGIESEELDDPGEDVAVASFLRSRCQYPTASRSTQKAHGIKMEATLGRSQLLLLCHHRPHLALNRQTRALVRLRRRRKQADEAEKFGSSGNERVLSFAICSGEISARRRRSEGTLLGRLDDGGFLHELRVGRVEILVRVVELAVHRLELGEEVGDCDAVPVEEEGVRGVEGNRLGELRLGSCDGLIGRRVGSVVVGGSPLHDQDAACLRTSDAV